MKATLVATCCGLAGGSTPTAAPAREAGVGAVPRLFRGLVAGTLAVLLPCAGLSAQAWSEGTTVEVALTFDDLPWVGGPPVDGTPTEAVQRMAAVLNVHGAPATGFVVCDRWAEQSGPVSAWSAWGLAVGNHSSAHRDLDETEVGAWIDDVLGCHERLEAVDGYGGLFRYPMLHQGRTRTVRDSVVAALGAAGLRNAHVTVDTSDWILTLHHARAVAREDAVLRRMVGEAFVAHVRDAVRHADRIARRKAGRPVPQVLLLHANALVEDYLDELLLGLREDGVRFVGLEVALADPVYRREDGYVGGKGLSWLYRMEPATPEDVRWDDREADRLRRAWARAEAARPESESRTHVSALPVDRMATPGLQDALEEAGRSERWRSLLVSRGGETLVEAYFNGVDEEVPANLKSVTKSLTAALVGVALQEQWIDSLEEPVGSYLPSDRGTGTAADLPFEALLTMSTGLRPADYGLFQQEEDWTASVLGTGVDAAWRGTFRYDTPVLQPVVEALEEASGRELQEMVDDFLLAGGAERVPYWREGPRGRAFGGNDAYLTPRGMLALGELFLRGGMVQGRRVLPSGFVRRATTVQARPPGDSVNHGTLPVRGYGYLWWLTRIGGEEAHAALGHGGQMIFVLPARETVVVVTSRWPMESSSEHYAHVIRMLNEALLPMVWSDQG